MGATRQVVKGISSSFYLVFTVPVQLEEQVLELIKENKFLSREYPCRVINHRSWKTLVTIRRANVLRNMLMEMYRKNNLEPYD